jgi:hemerythrin-like domain-containing protein
MMSSREKINTVGAKETYNKLAEFYNNELVKHFQEEESILVPRLIDNALILRMCDEHNKLREIFAYLGTSDDIENTLISFGKLLESHIRFEERELFPMIESTLPEDTLVEIGNMIKVKKGAI